MELRLKRQVECYDGHFIFMHLHKRDAEKMLTSGAVRVKDTRGSVVTSVELTRPRERRVKPKPTTFSSGSVAVAFASDISRRAAQRAACLASAAGSHTAAEWLEVIARYGNSCLRCGVSGESVTMTKDHIVPVSTGGTDYASNLQPLCLACNSWKGNREIDFRGPLAFTAAVA